MRANTAIVHHYQAAVAASDEQNEAPMLGGLEMLHLELEAEWPIETVATSRRASATGWPPCAKEPI